MNNIEIKLKTFLFPKNKKVYHKDFKNGKIIEDTENLCKENEVFVLFENNLPYLKSSHNIYAFSDFTKSDIVEIKDLDFNIDRDRYYGLNIGDFIMYNKEYGFVYDYDDFDNNYDVNDYYATNKDAIIQKTSDQLQHTAAGAGVGRGTGAANQIATGVADKNESLYKDALEAMNSDRTFAYNLWNSNIQNAQNRLNQLKSAKDTQLSLYGNLATDYTDTQASKYQDLLAAQQQAANNKLQLTLASI